MPPSADHVPAVDVVDAEPAERHLRVARAECTVVLSANLLINGAEAEDEAFIMANAGLTSYVVGWRRARPEERAPGWRGAWSGDTSELEGPRPAVVVEPPPGRRRRPSLRARQAHGRVQPGVDRRPGRCGRVTGGSRDALSQWPAARPRPGRCFAGSSTPCTPATSTPRAGRRWGCCAAWREQPSRSRPLLSGRLARPESGSRKASGLVSCGRPRQQSSVSCSLTGDDARRRLRTSLDR